MAPKINFFFAPGACSLAGHILLIETGVPFSTTFVNVHEPFPEKFLKLNPKGQVPFMGLDNEIITENPAIMTAISQLAPSKHLFGNTPLENVRVYEWLNYLSGKLHGQAYGMIFRPLRFGKDETTADAVKEKGWETAKACYSLIDKSLEGKEWAVGDDFTCADPYLFVFYRWGNAHGVDMKNDYPNYARLVEKLSKRESVQQAVKAEGIDLMGATM